MLADPTGVPDPPRRAAQSLFWASVWLAIVLVAVKAYYLTLPDAVPWADEQATPAVRLLAAISYVDVLFAAGLWIAARAALALAGRRRLATRTITTTFVVCAALASLYAVASIIVYGVLGGFLTYQLLALIGDVGMLRSSVAAYLTPPVAIGLVSLPLVFVALVLATARGMRAWRGARVAAARDRIGRAERLADRRPARVRRRLGRASGAGDRRQPALGAGVLVVARGRGRREPCRWPSRLTPATWPISRRSVPLICPHQVVASAEARSGTALVPKGASCRGADALAGSRAAGAAAARRPPNVILVVLESVAARWASLNGGLYDSTPILAAESARGLVFDNFYAHIGRSSNSLVAMLLSAYPKLDFHDVTEQYPRLAGTSLGTVFRDRGYRTGVRHAERFELGGVGDVPRGTRLRRIARRRRPRRARIPFHPGASKIGAWWTG